MNEYKTEKSYHLIAGILLIVALAVQYLLAPLIYGYTINFTFWGIVCILVLLGTAVLMLLNRRDLFTVIAIALIAIVTVYNHISYFGMEGYSPFLVCGFEYDYGDGYFGKYTMISYFLVFVELLRPLAVLFLLIIAAANFTDFLGNAKNKLNKLWFLPCVLMAVYSVMTQLDPVVTEMFGLLCTYYYSAMSFIFFLLQAAAFLFAGLWVAHPNELPKSEASYSSEENYATAHTETVPEAYCDMLKHVLLLLFTCGIWMLIWVYRMTGYTNTVKGEEKRNPTNKLLLYIFVPFYSIYWIYKTAQRIDKMARAKNIESDMATLCLILAIFVPVVAAILMQDKMNKIVKTKGIRASENETAYGTTIGVADELKKYKELLDAGIITEEEFKTKKKQLLGMSSSTSPYGEPEPKFDPRDAFRAEVIDAVMRHLRVYYSGVKSVNTTISNIAVGGNIYTAKGKVVVMNDYAEQYEGKVTAVYEFDEETQAFTGIRLVVGDGDKGTLHKVR